MWRKDSSVRLSGTAALGLGLRQWTRLNDRTRLNGIESWRRSRRTRSTFSIGDSQAEAGHVSQALLSAHEWASAEDPLPQFADLVTAAYGEGPVHDADQYVLWQAKAAEALPSGWFYDRLAERLARRANDAALMARIQEQSAVRVDRQFVRSHRLTLVELGAMAVGTVVCALLWFRRNEPSSIVRLHEPGVPPPWPGGIGAAVLLRGGAIGAMLTALFLLYRHPTMSRSGHWPFR